VGKRAAQVVARERMLLERHEMQLLARAGSSRHAAQVARKLVPVPNPVSTIVNVRLPCQRAGSRLPAMNT
jgi:hypothetical protein